MNKYLVQYSTRDFKKLLIVIWGNNKEDVKKMLKRHLGNTLYTINKISEVEADE